MTPSRTVVLFVLLFASIAGRADDALDAAFEREVLVIIANEHACLLFDIYIATSYAQQRRGLMFVRDLPERTGMLFVYPDEQLRSMWMKNTYIPLDIAFARRDGTIVNVVRDTQPQSLESIYSAGPARYVLEVNAGVTDRLAIAAGSRILWGPIIAQWSRP